MPRDRDKTADAPAAPTPPSDLEIEVTRAIDQELEWYFRYAETAHRLGSVTFLPSHEATRLAAAEDYEAASARRGLELATTVKVVLGAIPAHHAGVLRAVYTPRRWPTAVTREFESLAAIAVRLVCTSHPWPARSQHDGLETAAAQHLANLLARDSAKPAVLRKRARRLLGAAITAYVRTRHKGASPIEKAG